ncbi:MAG: hypothetical protein ACI9VR_001751 [Cognaticolwellia sp.]
MQLTLLAIDRDPLLLQSVGRILRPHRVLQTTGGLLGMTILRSGQRVGGVLAGLDLGGLSGLEVLLELSLEYPDLAKRFAFLAPHSHQLAIEGVPILGRPPDPAALVQWSVSPRGRLPQSQIRHLHS